MVEMALVETEAVMLSPDQCNKAIEALKEIARMKGMCTYGISELIDASKETQCAFRLGSGMAYDAMASIAQKALEDIL